MDFPISGKGYMYAEEIGVKRRNPFNRGLFAFTSGLYENERGSVCSGICNPRAGEIEIIGKALSHKELGIGVINPRTDEIETVEFIVEKVEKALDYFPPENIFLNTDCGFGCFAERCVNDEENAFLKIRQMVKAANILRKKYS
ncbi:MAG: hypothetical protein R2750_10930 [Bacteroidales bacterium]